ncbi:MAG TPA: DegT/DnrJ/EryC1/StrS family aminotransferase [Verrucomicrobiae bacterium]|nr:DegT/DnrJ/EryC1/StrS family aminotransferase [Verrucomicrobiae bacterium]
MGRDALGALPSVLKLQHQDSVLLPAYLCGEVVKPFLGRNSVEFYDIGEDLVVDPQYLEERLVTSKAKAVLIINYFGFLQPFRSEIKEICHKRGALLIEDCAHSLLTAGSGIVGDITIYSLRKHLPLPDGGGLKIAHKEQSVPIDFHSRFRSNTFSLLSSLKSILRLNIAGLSRSGLSRQSPQSCGDVKPVSAALKRKVLPISTFAYNGFGNADLKAVYARCRTDYDFWQKKTADFGKFFQPLFPELASGVCPLGFPLVAQERTTIKERFAAGGIHLKVYWKLPPAVPSHFAMSQKLAAQVFTLPIYPDLRPGQREKITKILESIASIPRSSRADALASSPRLASRT